MNRGHLIVFGCLTFIALPAANFGQSPFDAKNPADAESLAPTVSVRELKIPEKARSAFRKGVQRFDRQDWGGSIGEFQRAIAAYSEFYEAYYKIGLAKLELQLGGDAEAAFRKCIELSEGRFAPPMFGLGLTLANGNRFGDALDFVRAGLDLDPTSARGYFALAWVFYTAGRLVEAEQSAKQAVRYNPNLAMAHLLLAQVHRRQNDSAAMVEELDAFLRIDPDSPRSRGIRAVRDEAAQGLRRTAADVARIEAER
jgi:tetratricopeptide (TPR) repeat protein